MPYKVEFKEGAIKSLQKLDKQVLRLIKNWIQKNLEFTEDPRIHGKALTGNLKGVWRYRVGDYRLFAEINEDIVTIFIFEIGHRREIYKIKK
ncbi:MAG: type II toxin-antitoxin system RelE family toxin [Cetobacterium sp.]|uniref:type II toxin-antitoxin system RelE family toxin n=1 Tax=Cetobacterium sp. TaxID=2071632 RepID=UPI003EE4CC13